MVPSGVPLLAAAATVTRAIREDVSDELDMRGCAVIRVSPNRPDIYYEVRPRTTVEGDMEHLVSSLRLHANKADRVMVYCRSLNMCADLYEHFHNSLGDVSYYPVGSKPVSDNRQFGMYHSNTLLTVRRSSFTACRKKMELFVWYLQPWLWVWVSTL